MDDFISEDDLLTFEGFLKYQGLDPAAMTPEQLEMWRGYFDEAVARTKAGPKVGLMKLQPVAGEQKYAVAIRDGSDLWLTLWVRCSWKGEIFIMYPRGDREWNAHASYHLDGTFHQKGFGATFGSAKKRQPLTAAFRGSEHLGAYGGHGKASGAVCNPKAFDGVVCNDPGILGPVHGVVAVDLLAPGLDPKPFAEAHQRRVFQRNGRPSVVITTMSSEVQNTVWAMRPPTAWILGPPAAATG